MLAYVRNDVDQDPASRRSPGSAALHQKSAADQHGYERQPRGPPPHSFSSGREHLTPHEVERLIEAAGKNRHGHRDATMVLLAYRHGLRASEVTDLRWEQVDLKSAARPAVGGDTRRRHT